MRQSCAASDVRNCGIAWSKLPSHPPSHMNLNFVTSYALVYRPDCHHVCATEGCGELLTLAAARSRYTRCPRCRKISAALERKRAKSATADSPVGSEQSASEAVAASPLVLAPTANGNGAASSALPEEHIDAMDGLQLPPIKRASKRSKGEPDVQEIPMLASVSSDK